MAGEMLLICVSLLVAEVTGQNVNISVSTTRAVSVIDDHFIGVTLDSSFLPVSANLFGLNFSSPTIQLLAKSLSPSYLRIGGTLADEITFDPTGHGGTRENETYTGATWDRLNKFTKTVGWDIVFGLNALQRKGLEWDPTNSMELISYSLARNYTFAGLELGNEPQYFPGLPRGTISGGQLGRDFMTLRNIMQNTPGLDSTLLIGSDNTGVKPGSDQMFKEFFAGIGSLAVDRITVHQYYGYKGDATTAECLDPALMDTLIDVINIVYNVTKKSNPDTPVWLGETSSFWGGGAPGISDRYVAGFLWLDKLGIAARMGIKNVMRQSFYGMNYSLVEKDTFHPCPDFWLTVLYKRLVGNNVLSVTSDGGRNFRVYAHCTSGKSPYGYPPGSVTVFYLNMYWNNTIKLTQFQDKVLQIYSLSPSTVGNLTDRYVALNGQKLEFINNHLPDLEPVRSVGGIVKIQANTFGFIVIPDANLDICKQ